MALMQEHAQSEERVRRRSHASGGEGSGIQLRKQRQMRSLTSSASGSETRVILRQGSLVLSGCGEMGADCAP
jgi:hypothetical protein